MIDKCLSSAKHSVELVLPVVCKRERKGHAAEDIVQDQLSGKVDHKLVLVFLCLSLC